MPGSWPVRDLEQHHVVVAIEAHLVHLLHMARFFAPDHNLPRERLSEVPARPSSAVLARASRFIQANISVATCRPFLRLHGHQALRVPFGSSHSNQFADAIET